VIQSRRSAPGFIGSSSDREISGEGLGIATPMVDAFRRGSPTSAGRHSGLLHLVSKIQSRAAAPGAALPVAQDVRASLMYLGALGGHDA
jgi:hypothetical protein